MIWKQSLSEGGPIMSNEQALNRDDVIFASNLCSMLW